MNDIADIRKIRESAERIRVRGLVQGVGFRPAVWRLAHRYGLRGWVANDGEGVDIHVCGPAAALHQFVGALEQETPPLARIDRVEREPAALLEQGEDFRIVESFATSVHTGVVPDAATCPACVAEIFNPLARRYRYPFTNCTHCGPRLSIIEAIPYDRAATTMRTFALCAACSAEYNNPNDRRFHAQPVACHACGPRAWLERADGAPIALDTLTTLDAVDAACTLLQRGRIVAIKGLGGFQLACDAGNEAAVARLRQLKQRERKPFALMARDLDVVRRYCVVAATEEALLQSPAAPIVIMTADGSDRIAANVAPGVQTLGFMLPNTPLHHLLLQRMNRPIVLTSGNLSDEPQCITNTEARTRLLGIAEYFLLHDRDIARRVDDSVVRAMAGGPRSLRRARGFAPATMPLPQGFVAAPAVLGMGGELKNTFCLLRDGQAIVSHHMGDLEDALTHADYRSSLERYLHLFEHEPRSIAVDMHPEYLSAKLGSELAQQRSVTLARVQHHHAHIAACMAENGYALDAAPVLGVALDGLGYGSDGTLWGGEFLLADYRDFKRLGTFKPVVMPGGEQAIYEPWRNTYAHLMSEMGWVRFAMDYSELDLYRFLSAKPRTVLDAMIARGINSPPASSCGRLFDAAAAAVGICRERAQYEGEAAVEFEALVDERTLSEEDEQRAYPFTIACLHSNNLPYIEPLAMWRALFGDLMLGTPLPVIAARFHKGLAIVIARMVEKLSRYEGSEGPVRVVALSGGVFQNRVLLEQVSARLLAAGFHVLVHRHVPAN
ncbi:MAG: carbamoyltransferase HypF, partial [Betaproteobacteria bacterium]|nr:carbamoyltransferase HypF [Betaproteobacteria bacterium]